PEIEEIFATSNLNEAQLFINEQKPQLVFLDVEMPRKTGFEFLLSQKEKNFDIIFTTAFSKYAIQAIRFSAIDFLLKPVQPDELRAAFERFLNQPREVERRQKLYEHLFENLNAKNETAFKLSLSKGNRQYFISPQEIYYCKADDNYTKVYLKDNTEFIITKTLKEVDEMLHEYGFIRTHKSSMVNKIHIANLKNDSAVVLNNNVEIEISRRRLQEVKGNISH
ncbi:MAG: LytTR family DNA-binding domain-containing protein, partial [Bacteroidota bacterium]